MFLILTEIVHLSTSLLVGWWFWDQAGFWGVMSALLTGFFVDSDHLIDYWLYLRDWRKFSLKGFLSGEHFRKSGNLYILFHGWEYGIITFIIWLLAITLLWQSSYLLLVMGVSHWLHLLVDQLTNDVNWNTYFVTNRFKKNWESVC